MLIIIYIESREIYCINNLSIIIIDSKIDNLINNVYTKYMLRSLYKNNLKIYLKYIL
jgi:hypothetical protein